MTPAEADLLVAEKLGVSPRAVHSRQVGRLMAALAARFEADRDLWTVVGLVHDIDYFAVNGDWTQHGVLAASWLKDRLPQEALLAIAAHDHRTGVNGDGLLFDMLKFADAMATPPNTPPSMTTPRRRHTRDFESWSCPAPSSPTSSKRSVVAMALVSRNFLHSGPLGRAPIESLRAPETFGRIVPLLFYTV